MFKTALSVVVVLGMLGANVLAAGDPAAGKAKSVVCTACHGPDGNSTNPEWPSLAGQNADYIAKQILAFQKGEARANVLMAPMIASLSAQDVEDVAAYFASLPRRGMLADKTKAAQIREGERLYRGGDKSKGIAACMGCHGPDGSGNALAGFPSLSSQHATYTAIQLRAFRSGQRSSDMNGMMRDVAAPLSDAQIEAVSAYLTGLN